MDYGKYLFEQAKREKEAKKKQKTVEIKEIRLGLSIDVHDFETKATKPKNSSQVGIRSRFPFVSEVVSWVTLKSVWTL